MTALQTFFHPVVLVSLMWWCVGCAFPDVAVVSRTISPQTSTGGLVYVDDTYRKFAGADADPAWIDGYDTMANMGFKMLKVQGGQLDKVVSVVSTPIGDVHFQAQPPLFKTDFHRAYDIATNWPYCESLEKCVVYSQLDEPMPADSITISLPDRVGSIDFYVDGAIDCVNVTRARIVCAIVVTADDGEQLQVSRPFRSVCDSPDVGRYFGFFNNRKGGAIESLSLTCTTRYPRVLGLIRIGASKPKSQSEVV